MDLNADLGEGFGIWALGDDAALLDVITSANVACGFHAGDPSIMRRVCVAASDRAVRVGAQVGYRDLAGFGRRRIDYAFDELRDDVLYQIAALGGFCAVAGTRVSYVKPHGALYNTAARDLDIARVVARAVGEVDPTLRLVGLGGSRLLEAGREVGLGVAAEAFADRRYAPDGSLAPRALERAVIRDAGEAADQAVCIVCEHEVLAFDGTRVAVVADTLCIHGDTDGAVAIAAAVRRRLEQGGVVVSRL
jgi:5-oxoprolinase (ATP-hydrolysing) subunit A